MIINDTVLIQAIGKAHTVFIFRKDGQEVEVNTRNLTDIKTNYNITDEEAEAIKYYVKFEFGAEKRID